MRPIFTWVFASSLVLLTTSVVPRVASIAAGETTEEVDANEPEGIDWSDVDSADLDRPPVSALSLMNRAVNRSMMPVEFGTFMRSRKDAFSELHNKLTEGFTHFDHFFGRRAPSIGDSFQNAKRSFVMMELPSGTWITPAGRILDSNLPAPLFQFAENDSYYQQVGLFNSNLKFAFADWVAESCHLESKGLMEALNARISRTRWKLDQADLVGAINIAAPVSYKSSDIPDIDKHANGPTRPVTAFEQRAIRELRSATVENIVVSETPDEIQIVGALRATHACQRCHNCERGELLGGISYRWSLVAVDRSDNK